MSAWATFINNDLHPKEVLAGDTQYIRTDDFIVSLALMLAQVAHDPPFPVVNLNIGNGQNMLIVPNLPVRHPLLIVRPQAWGFLLGGDFGLAWLWWFRMFGLFVAAFLLLRIFSHGDSRIAVFGAIGFCFSPFLQYWSLGAAEFYIWSIFSVVCLVRLIFSTRRQEILCLMPIFCWTIACFVMLLYPTYQIYSGYAGIALFVSILLGKRSEWQNLSKLKNLKLTAALFAVGGTAIAVWLFFRDTGDAAALMVETVYPGSIRSSGGGIPLIKILSNYYAIFQATNLAEVFQNECEASGYALMMPCALGAILLKGVGGDRSDWLSALPLVLFAVFVCSWLTLGFPGWLADLTLLNRAPPHRGLVAFGVVNIALLALALRPQQSIYLNHNNQKIRFVLAIGLFVAWFVLIRWVGLELLAVLSISRDVMVANGLFVLGLGAAILARRWWGALMFALLSVYSSWSFNPLVRGTYDSVIISSPLSREILAIDQRMDGQSKWVVLGRRMLENLPRMLGVHAINGNHYYPQLELWRTIDPESKFRDAYNRYAHVVFSMQDGPGDRFDGVIFDSFEVNTWKGDNLFPKLGVTHVLATGKDQVDKMLSSGYPLLYRQSDDIGIFQVNSPRPSD